MNALSVLPYRLSRWLATCHHNRAIEAIERTPPLRAAPSGLMLLSMLRHSDVRMYLVAIKSISARLGPAAITIVDDGSLTRDDRAVLDHHLGNFHYIPIDEVDTGVCPRGGTWERLVAILDLTRDYYVIQVDADIVALGDLAEVVECVRDNRAFALAGNRLSVLETAGETSARTLKWGPIRHVQPTAEQIIGEMPGAGSLKYIWGSSAFAGFPRGTRGRRALSEFSMWMEGRLQRIWHEWGSEQVASNFVIANLPTPAILPWPKYQSYDPSYEVCDANLIHFIGTYRFVDGAYMQASRRAITTLLEME